MGLDLYLAEPFMNLPKIDLGASTPQMVKVGDGIDYYQLFCLLEQEQEHCFLLESLGEESHDVRYSIIGWQPQHLIEARGRELTVDDKTYSVKNPYNALREMMPPRVLGHKYAGGLVGYMSYESMNYFEPVLQLEEHPKFAPFRFGVYPDGLIYDKMTNELWYFFYQNSRLAEALDYVRRWREQKRFSLPEVKVKLHGPDISREEFSQTVMQVKEEIKAGNTFQCEVGFKSEYELDGPPLAIYDAMREVNPSPFMYYIKFGDQKILGDSPELLLRLTNDILESFPLAGTTKRDGDPVKDKLLAAQLLSDEKERAEHKMLVDLHRHDLGRVAKIGTVRVRSLMEIKKFSHVQHIGSEIVGILAEEEDMFSAVAATFPVGTLTGAPKIESMKIIERNEKTPRGPYGGGSGILSFNGDCALAVNIRSLFIDRNYAYTQTCSGNVYDSDPEREYEEVKRKLASMEATMERFT